MISIPYGAIKSIESYSLRIVYNIFQFLMVRLKDGEPEAEKSPKGIFQFLMVRLKVSTTAKRLEP